MADVRPFRPWCYEDAHLPDVIAPPYDVIDGTLRSELGLRSEHNIVHVDLPAGDGDKKYGIAAELLERWRDEGVLKAKGRQGYLVYEQTFTPEGASPDQKVTRRGFFGLVRATPYKNKDVLPHERTLSGPKVDRMNLFQATKAAISPVFLLYADRESIIREVLSSVTYEADFVSDDGIRHRLGFMDDPGCTEKVSKALEETPLLIADGHHRYETTVDYAATMNQALARPADDSGAHNFVMAFMCDGDDPSLIVNGTHRLVFGLIGFEPEIFLDRVRKFFEVNEFGQDLDGGMAALNERGKSTPSFLVKFANKWDRPLCLLSVRSDVKLTENAAMAALHPTIQVTDVGILHTLILEEMLGIDRKKQADKSHLKYYKQNQKALEDFLQEGDLLIFMNGTPVEQVRSACLAGQVMPQKSTYFYPKIPTGLAVHLLDPDVKV